MNHFGRFRVINDTDEDTNQPGSQQVVKATFTLGDPAVLKTCVGFGTQFMMLPQQYYAEVDLEPGLVTATKVTVDLSLANGKHIDDWDLAVGDAIELRSIDIKISYRAATDTDPEEWRARATAAGWNYEFREVAKREFIS